MRLLGDDDSTYVFDIGARVDSDHVSVLDTQVVTNNAVDSSTPVIESIVCQNNENRILSLLASD